MFGALRTAARAHGVVGRMWPHARRSVLATTRNTHGTVRTFYTARAWGTRAATERPSDEDVVESVLKGGGAAHPGVEDEGMPPVLPSSLPVWRKTYKKMMHMHERKRTLQGSARAVHQAFLGNMVVCAAKAGAFVFTGSAAMLGEAVHSFADTINQGLLAVGIRRSLRRPDELHPYGYSGERYVWSLISATGLLFLGCGVTMYHGVQQLMHPHVISNIPLALGILGLSMVVETYTLGVAYQEVKRSAIRNRMSLMEYVRRGDDPTGVAVLVEDAVAVGGVGIAATALGLSYYTGNFAWDAYGSIAIGTMLGGVATFLIRKNESLLVGRAMDPSLVEMVTESLRRDAVVRSVHDVKSVSIGVEDYRFKAEINFDGERLSRMWLQNYLEQTDQSMEDLLHASPEDLEQLLVACGTGTIETLGSEIDRLEAKAKGVLPQVKHIDIEVI